MRLLKRLLGCQYPRRRHLESCEECRLQLRRERQYLERLRGAEVPAASDDLTARLLAHTEELARTEETAGTRGRAGTDQPGPYPFSSAPAARGFRPALRAAVLAAGGAAAAAALLGGAAFVMGSEPAPGAGGTAASAFLQRDLAAAAPAAVEAGPGTPAGWSLTGEPDFTPDGALTSEQLAALRSEGWTCPELRELGYHLVWARGGVLAGVNILELRVTDGRRFATILEQHTELPAELPGPAGPRTAPPVNVLTGRPATSDGFTAVTVPGGTDATGAEAETGGVPPAGNGVLWVRQGSPFAAIYQNDGATFTYVSDQPAGQADDGVAALVHAATGAAEPAAGDGDGSGSGHNLTARLERGLGRILELLAP